MTLYILVHKR